jgi:hypothetical protein
MITASEPTSVAGSRAERTGVLGGLKTGDVDLGWAVVDTAPDVVPGDDRRPLPKTPLVFLGAIAMAAVAVAATALGAFVFGDREPERANGLQTHSTSAGPLPTPPAAPPTHAVLMPVLELAGNHAPVPPSVTSEPRPTIVIEAAPPAAAEISPPAPVPSPYFDPARDQWLLDNLRSLGYTIINPALVISSAYQACHLFQQGAAPEQVNRQMSATTGLNIDDTLQLTSSAMLAYYPNCA